MGLVDRGLTISGPEKVVLKAMSKEENIIWNEYVLAERGALY